MTSHTFAISDHEENILGHNILKGKVWQLPNVNVWLFGPAKTPNSKFSGENRKMNLLKMSPFLPGSTATNITNNCFPCSQRRDKLSN